MCVCVCVCVCVGKAGSFNKENTLYGVSDVGSDRHLCVLMCVK